MSLVSAADVSAGRCRLVQRPDTIGHLLFPVRPLQDNLARCYDNWRVILSSSRACLILILKIKPGTAVRFGSRQRSADGDIDQTKLSLLTRLRGDRGQRGTLARCIITLSHRIFTSVPALLYSVSNIA